MSDGCSHSHSHKSSFEKSTEGQPVLGKAGAAVA